MKAWQNGYVRNGTQIGFGCAGCGKYIFATYAIEENLPPPPEYPFEEGDCPVCELEEKLIKLDAKVFNQEHSPVDKLTERMLLLEKARKNDRP